MSDPADLRSALALADTGSVPAPPARTAGTRYGPRYDLRMRIAGLTHLGGRSPGPPREALLVWESEGGAVG